MAWVLWWALSYRGSSTPHFVTGSGLVPVARSGKLLSIRSVQVLVFAKFMSDSAWYFLLFWLPKYLYDARHFDIKQVSYYAWIPICCLGHRKLSWRAIFPAVFCAAASVIDQSAQNRRSD